MKPVQPAYVAAAVAFVITWIVSHGRSSPYNNFVLLADAFNHGHVWINWPGEYIDALGWRGLHYVIEAPMPAILLMPFVALFGMAVNQTLLAIVLASVAIGAAWKTAEHLGVAPRHNAWLCAFLLAGTDLLWCAMLGDVWFIAHVAGVCFTMLALAEVTGKRRGWLVALYAGAAIESRFAMIVVVPVYAYVLYAFAANRRRELLSFALALVPFAIFWIGYNEARWNTWYDIGYTEWYHQDAAGMPSGSPFRLMYLPYELQSFFVQLPTFKNVFPYVTPEMTGQALTWTSPALILALFARGDRRLIAAFAVAAVLSAGPNFIYYVNGFAQFGMRHALDFEPFLFALMALAATRTLPRWGYALIAYSIAVGLWGCWYWNAFYRATS